MSNKATFRLASVALALLGSYGLLAIFNEQPRSANNDINKTFTTTEVKTNPISPPPNAVVSHNQTGSAEFYTAEVLRTISARLQNQHFVEAVEYVDSNYQQLSSEQLESVSAVFLNTARQLAHSGATDQAINLLTLFNNAFNNLNGWVLLGEVHLANQQWQAAIHAFSTASSLEYRPEKLQSLMSYLVSASSSQRHALEQQNNEIGINSMYQQLHDTHPGSARFQLELALSHLRLNNDKTAKALLDALQYDTEYGAIASTALSTLENTASIRPAEEAKTNSRANTNEIVIPLLRSGNSFFINTIINGRQLTLLLDTGASITALSSSSIQSLNLDATGKQIQLNTANGTRRSELYRTDQIRLGSLSIENTIIAAVELNKTSQFHGLLGTDILNQLDDRYTYVIDNQKNALIFKPK